MNEGQYIAIRNYLEGISSTLSQLLTAQKRTSELLEARGAPSAILKLPDGIDLSEVGLRPILTMDSAAEITRIRSEPQPTEPWHGYDDMTVADVLAKAEDASDATRAHALDYEVKHKKRKTVIEALENWLS